MQKNLQHYSFTCCLLSPNLSMIAGTTEINKKIHITSVWSQLHKMSTKTSCGLHLSVHVDWNIYSHTLNAFCLPHDNEQNCTCCTVLQGKKNWLKWQSVKLTSWLIRRSPILCERALFPASFASSAGRKNTTPWLHWDHGSQGFKLKKM